MRLHAWMGGGVTVGMCGGGVRCVGRGHGGSVGIRTPEVGEQVSPSEVGERYVPSEVGERYTPSVVRERGGSTVGSWPVARVVLIA